MIERFVEYYYTIDDNAPFKGYRGSEGILERLSEETAMKSRINYHDDLMKDLKNSKTALAYLNAALKDKYPEVFLLALRDVAQAWGGMTKLARLSKRPRVSLYKILSKQGNPEIQSLDNILRAMGLRLAVMPEKHSHLKKAA